VRCEDDYGRRFEGFTEGKEVIFVGVLFEGKHGGAMGEEERGESCFW